MELEMIKGSNDEQNGTDEETKTQKALKYNGLENAFYHLIERQRIRAGFS
jgi:hypothetical protein|tara:strand:+ start:115 stop:264 length:150 start_codon:yes stop_codon:yes gene_type:complete